MKKVFLFLIVGIFYFCNLFPENSLVVYFSATGTTKTVAEKISKTFNANIWEIEPLEPYTPKDLDWRDSMSRSSLEYGDTSFRPTIKMCTDIRAYSTIFLGFPIWWNTCPRIIQSWIENNDLSDKTIIVFGTSSRSSLDRSFWNLRNLYAPYKWVKGRVFHTIPTDKDLMQWKNELEKQVSDNNTLPED